MFRGVGADEEFGREQRGGWDLSEASKKFQEAAAIGTFNWGNVHMCSARKKWTVGENHRLRRGGNPGAAIATAANFDEVEKD